MNVFKLQFENRLSDFLSKPYPFYYSGRSLWIISGLLFIMTLFFNYLFEPFEVYVPEHKMGFFWICFVHAVVPVLVLLLISIFIKQGKMGGQWTLKKEFTFILSFIVIVGIAQFLIRKNSPRLCLVGKVESLKTLGFHML